MATPAPARWVGVLPWLALLAFAASLGLQDIRTFDYWWHLRTGELIAQSGSVPRVDPYTYTVNGWRWVDIHWLHQLGLHALYRTGGHAAVVVAKAVFACGLVALLAPIGARRARPLLSVAVLAWMLAIVCERFMPRPELPTFLCLAGVLALLDRHARAPDAWVYGIVPIQLVWVNLHGLFALGIALCAIYGLGELLRPLVAPGESLRRERVRRLAAVTALAAGVTLVNPNGLDGALYPVQQLGMIGPPEQRGVFGSLIAELIPPLAGGSSPLALWLAGGLAAFSFVGMALSWRRLPASDPLLWVAFGYLALGAQRNLALYALVAAPIAVRSWNDVLDARAARVAGASPRVGRLAAVAATAALLALTADVAAGRFYARLGTYRAPGLGVTEILYPAGAVDWIERERPRGPIFHHMADGGYLGWRLRDDYPVMVDGRLEVYGPERFVELQANGPVRFRALDAQYRFGAALVHYSLVESTELLWWLYLNSNWRLVYVDDVAALFVRAGGAEPAPPEVDLDAPDLFPPLEGAGDREDAMRRLARTNFLIAVRRWERALALWKETIALHPDLEQGRIIHALLLDRNGFGAAAEAILRELLAERPDDAKLYAQIGDLRLGAEDHRAAAELYDAALARDPKLAYALYRRASLAEAEGDAEAALALYLRVTARMHPADPIAVAARTRVLALQGSR